MEAATGSFPHLAQARRASVSVAVGDAAFPTTP